MPFLHSSSTRETVPPFARDMAPLNQHALHPSPPCSKTLERSYLLRINGQVVERPQHMLMRVSIGIHQDDVDAAIDTYHLMSERWFTHASPTLFNSGTPRPQLSSCFLLRMKGMQNVDSRKLV